MSDLEHHVPAVIKSADFRDAVQAAGVNIQQLHQVGVHPKLLLPASVELRCLHGYHRLETARKDPKCLEEWWLVDLYSSDVPVGNILHIRQHYRRHLPVPDGEKYLHIRFYQRRKDKDRESRWREQLSASKQKNLDQILRNEWLVGVLDDLEPFRSLWTNFQLASFRPILSWRCREEIEHYLREMHDAWDMITNSKGFLCDESTVYNLQALAPTWSARDQFKIEALFSNNQIFCRVNNPVERAQILGRVVTASGLITTFKTFFKHVQVLGPAMIGLRELFSPQKMRPSVSAMFQNSYNEIRIKPGRCLLQSEKGMRGVKVPESIHVKFAYWQVCLFSIRHHLNPRDRQLLGKKKTEQTVLSEYPGWLIRLSALAFELGFETDKIVELNQQNPDLCDIRRHLRDERPRDRFSISQEKFDTEARSRHNRQVIFEPRKAAPAPLMTTNVADGGTSTESYSRLFLPFVQDALKQGPNYALTDFGTLVLILVAFFGNFGQLSEVQLSERKFLESFRETGSNRTDTSQDAVEPEIHLDATEKQSTGIGGHSGSMLSPTSSLYSWPRTTYTPKYRETAPQRVITFWHLPHDRNNALSRSFQCTATEAAVTKTVKEICTIGGGKKPTFMLAHQDGRLLACLHEHICPRSLQSNQPNNVYYCYENEDWREWIGKRLDENSQIWVDEYNPWKT